VELDVPGAIEEVEDSFLHRILRLISELNETIARWGRSPDRTAP
jgi:hypothetical protein